MTGTEEIILLSQIVESAAILGVAVGLLWAFFRD